MATTPLELLGTGTGLSVIDPGTILTRLWYFDGKFLRADGFRLDQDYVRSLAALSHQATGSGVVHGYDVSRPAGDTLRITGGLALAPSGRVAYLPRQADLGIGELIARSAGTADPAQPPAPGVADFRRCAPEEAAGPDVTVAGRPLYLLTVAGIEALCGEEERFGQLCADACATETDRSTVVEGVCFRLRELVLALPASSTVPFDDRHLRSRVASAYYAAERAAVPSRISGAGLATPVWCAGAEAVGGDEVPLAVLDRAGGVTTLLDGWTARRELQESSPRRYWQWRTAMRPWDVFLAQLLQFQCQLRDLGGSGSLLDGGLVELPPAGYLPVALDRPVQEQVRALFGAGVDLRFCVVRPDYVPEALQEAQHLDRISLTRGLDDPDRREAVDVLVPDGVIGAAAPAATAFTGTGRILSVVRGADGEDESAITLSVVARDRAGPGWSWTAAAYGEAPRQVSVRDLANASLAAMFRPPADAAADPLAGIPVRPDAEHDRIRRTAAFTQRLVAEGRAAAGRRTVLLGATGGRLPADRPLADGADRPVTIWLDGATSVGVDTLPINGSTDVRARVTLYSRASTRPVFNDVRLTGTIRVTDVLTLADRKVIRTVLDGVAEILAADSQEPRLQAVRSLPVSWTRFTSQRALTVGVGDPLVAVVELVEAGSPRHVSGQLLLPERTQGPRPVPVPVPAPRAGNRALATLEMQEQAGALAPGSAGLALAESVIAVLGAELAAPGRDPHFPQYATERLLGGLAAGGPEQVTATTDWVFFTRRRDRRCAGDVVEVPVTTRTYRLFHREQADGVATHGDMLRGAMAAGDFGFDPVATVQFAAGQVALTSPVADLRAGWLAADRADEITLAGVGDFADSDGEATALGRLSTVRSALADLADSSGAQVQYLPDIPAEFHQPGLHGAMFTIGVRRQVRTCVTIYRLLADAHKRAVSALRALGDSVPMSTVFERAQAVPDVFVAYLVDDVVVDADQIPGDWQHMRVTGGVYGFPSASGEEERKRLLLRATRVGEAIGLPAVEGGLPAQTGDCGAILLVAVEPVIG